MSSQALGIPAMAGLADTTAHGQRLERKHLKPCPLGLVGNLQFNAKQGGTPRASLVQELFLGIGRFLSCLAFRLACPSRQARTRRADLAQARINSSCVGNLLGRLTASANDAKGQSRAAQALARLGKRSKGDLSGLRGGRESLTRYLTEMSDADLIALRNGILACPDARKAVLKKIPKGELRDQAARVLGRIAEDVHERFNEKVVQEPLGQIAYRLCTCLMDKGKLKEQLEVNSLDGRKLEDLLFLGSVDGKDVGRLLSVGPVDGDALKTPLIRLARGLEQFKASWEASRIEYGDCHLDDYLYSLPDNQLRGLQRLLELGVLDLGIKALWESDDGAAQQQALVMLHRIRASLVFVGYFPKNSESSL